MHDVLVVSPEQNCTVLSRNHIHQRLLAPKAWRNLDRLQNTGYIQLQFDT